MLPLLALARTAASRLFAPIALPGAERLAGEVKQATYLEAAALIAAVPAGALFFGRILPRFLQSLGYSWWASQLPGVGFGFSLLLWKAGLSATAALVSGAVLAVAGAFAESLRSSRLTVVAFAIGLFVAGVLAYRPGTGLDLFEDGQIMTSAAELAQGARPYLDVYPVHGFGADGGWDAVLFRLSKDDLAVFRARRTVMTALALVFLGAATLLLFEDVAWGALALLSCLAFCPLVSERQLLPLAALCLFIRSARSGLPSAWFAAGVLSAVTLFSNLDFGLMLLVAGILSPVLLGLLDRTVLRQARTATLRFVFGVLAGSAPFGIYLAVRGSLLEFFRVSFVQIGPESTAAWGVPAPSLAQAARDGTLTSLLGVGEAVPSLWLLLLVLAVAAAVLTMRAAEGTITPMDRAVTVSTLVGVIALRGVLGRADSGHLFLYGVFAGLPATWLLYRATRQGRTQPLRAGISVLVFLFLLRPDRVITLQTQLVAGTSGRRHSELRSSTRLPGLGSAAVSRAQAADLNALRAVVDRLVPPGKTFFDFGNEPGLYFVLQRRPLIRYCCVPSYETLDRQREVVAALERERPPVAILASGSSLDAFDGVPSRDRAPLVAQYLDRNYRVLGRLGTRTIGVRRSDVGP